MNWKLIIAALLVFPVANANDANNGIPDRVSALEEMTLQQQGEIDQNSEDISKLKNWVVLDSTGEAVGEFLDFERYYVLTKIEFGGYSGTLTLAHGGIIADSYLFYLNYNCGGVGYAKKWFDDRWFGDLVFAYKPGETGGYIVPYRITGSPISTTMRSYITGNGVCVNYQRTYTVYPVDQTPLHNESLKVTYPGPFTVVKQ